MKKSLFCLALVLTVFSFSLTAQAALVGSLPDGTIVPIPAVNYDGSGPQTFSGITWTSTFQDSLFGYTGTYGYYFGGTWNGSLGPMIGLNSSSQDYATRDTMTFAFSTPQAGVGGFINYNLNGGFNYQPTVVAVYDSSMKLIESTTLTFGGNYGTNQGQFVGFLESTPDIKYLTLTDNYIGITDLTTEATPTPIPAAVWLLGSGLFGLVGLKRKNVKA